jgi:hypothetical protein
VVPMAEKAHFDEFFRVAPKQKFGFSVKIVKLLEIKKKLFDWLN